MRYSVARDSLVLDGIPNLSKAYSRLSRETAKRFGDPRRWLKTSGNASPIQSSPGACEPFSNGRTTRVSPPISVCAVPMTQQHSKKKSAAHARWIECIAAIIRALLPPTVRKSRTVVGFESAVRLHKTGIKQCETGMNQVVDFCFARCIFRLAATQSKQHFHETHLAHCADRGRLRTLGSATCFAALFCGSRRLRRIQVPNH